MVAAAWGYKQIASMPIVRLDLNSNETVGTTVQMFPWYDSYWQPRPVGMNCTEDGDIMIIFAAEIAASSRRFRITRISFRFDDSSGIS